MNQNRKIRVLLAKIGLDGHDRGIKVLAQSFRDAGMEVIYGGKFLTPQQVVEIALQEDVDVLGLSSLNGEHVIQATKVMALLKENNARDLLFLIGGVIPKSDIPTLKEIGVDGVFRADTSIPEIIKFIQEQAPIR